MENFENLWPGMAIYQNGYNGSDSGIDPGSDPGSDPQYVTLVDRLHNVYLISERTLKQRSLVTDPTLSVYIKPAIECAQKIGLTGVIGKCLLEKIQWLVTTKNLAETGLLINEPENAAYKNLLNEEITDYLVYSTMSYIVINARDKIRNAGIVNTVDNNYQQPDYKDEIQYLRRYYNDLSEFYGARLRERIEKNLELYPEYTCGDCCSNGGKQKHIYQCGIVL